MSLDKIREANPYLLPDIVRPERYTIHLIPNNEMTELKGIEIIELSVLQSTDQIVLHAVDMSFNSASLVSHDAVPEKFGTLSACKIEMNKKLQTVTFTFAKPIPVGKASLTLDFVSKISDTQMRGAYRTKYSVDGKDYIGIATQCEATDARRIIPCFDQPDMKAIFELSLTVPHPLTALGNGQISERGSFLFDDRYIQFEATPKMSSYLFAFAIGNYECIEAIDKNGVAIKVWATPGKEEWGRFALECALHALPFYQEKYGMPYPMTKLDMIAFPDFEAGAMENLGLVTFRETALLIDPNNNAVAARQRVAEVVDHELAHMWFGDIVTMQWWDDLWLNEGFATFMAAVAMHDKFPEWDIWGKFYSDKTRNALYEDALLSSKPIQVDVRDPDEIGESFGAIAYSKGASVIRMLEHFLGSDVFYKGIQLYLQRHAYKNAKTTDLWQALEDVSGKQIRNVMATFTEQPGYPVVCVDADDVCGALFINLQQKRFVVDGGPDSDELVWSIPIETINEEGLRHASIFAKREEKDFADFPSPGELDKDFEESPTHGHIKLNPGQSGYYRVAYSPDMSSNLSRAVCNGKLSKIDCIGLLDDSEALARAGHIRTSQTLKSLEAYRDMQVYRDYNIWTSILSSLGGVKNILLQTSSADYEVRRFNVFGRILVTPTAKHFGWDKQETDSDNDVLLRSQINGALGRFEDAPTLKHAEKLFNSTSQGNELDPDIRQVVYTLAAYNGNLGTFERLLDIYRATQDHQERQRVLRSFGGFSNHENIQKALLFSISDEVRKQDVFIPIAAMGTNVYARPLVWDFVKEHWSLFLEWFPEGFMMERLIEYPTSGFATIEALSDVESFFKDHPVPSAVRAMARSLESIRSNIAWITRDLNDIAYFLANMPTYIYY